jgi:hypothetical protein
MYSLWEIYSLRLTLKEPSITSCIRSCSLSNRNGFISVCVRITGMLTAPQFTFCKGRLTKDFSVFGWTNVIISSNSLHFANGSFLVLLKKDCHHFHPMSWVISIYSVSANTAVMSEGSRSRRPIHLAWQYAWSSVQKIPCFSNPAATRFILVKY